MGRRDGNKQMNTSEGGQPGEAHTAAKPKDKTPTWISRLSDELGVKKSVDKPIRWEKPRKSDIWYSKRSQASIEADKRFKKRKWKGRR